MAARVNKKEPVDRGDWKVCVVSPKESEAHIASIFVKAGFKREFSITEADIIVFYGTSSVHPFLYGEHDIKQNSDPFDVCRDKREIRLYKNLPYGKKVIGLNRGALLLNILSGGRSYQLVDGHEHTHRVRSKCATYNKKNPKKDIFYVNSEHRQLMIPPEQSLTLGVSFECTNKRTDRLISKMSEEECELVYHWQTETLCSQFVPNPELEEANEFFFSMVEEYLLP